MDPWTVVIVGTGTFLDLGGDLYDTSQAGRATFGVSIYYDDLVE